MCTKVHFIVHTFISVSMTSNATLSSHSSATNKQKISPENRSPVIGIDDNEDIDEDGAHDTITSLAGAKMLQRYRRAISGSHKSSASSLNQVRVFIKTNNTRLLFRYVSKAQGDQMELMKITQNPLKKPRMK